MGGSAKPRARRHVARALLIAASLVGTGACQALLDFASGRPDDGGRGVDGDVPADAAFSSDAGPGSPDGAREPCQPPHRFCDDFEDFDAARYDAMEQRNGTFFRADSGLASAGSFAVVTYPVGDASNDCTAYLQVPLTGAHWRIQFAIRLLEKGAGRYRAVQLTFEEGLPEAYSLMLWLNGSDGKLAIGSNLTGGSYVEFDSTEPTFDDQWHHIELDVDQSKRLVSLLIDRERVAVPSRSFPLPAGATNPSFRFGAARVHTPSTVWRVEFDNVRIDDLP